MWCHTGNNLKQIVSTEPEALDQHRPVNLRTCVIKQRKYKSVQFSVSFSLQGCERHRKSHQTSDDYSWWKIIPDPFNRGGLEENLIRGNDLTARPAVWIPRSCRFSVFHAVRGVSQTSLKSVRLKQCCNIKTNNIYSEALRVSRFHIVFHHSGFLVESCTHIFVDVRTNKETWNTSAVSGRIKI